MKIIRTLLSMSILFGILEGCGTFPSPEPTCMKPVLVSSLSRTPLYPILEDDPRAATISVVKTTCGSSKQEALSRRAQIEIDLALTIPEARRTFGRTKKALFPVFVALLDQQDNILDRLDAMIEVTITDKAVSHTQKITYHLPEGVDIDSKDHRLLVGFHGGVTASHSVMAHHPVKKVSHKSDGKGY
jgi:hypothetical protein